jgi:hypothetical protein
MIHTLLTLSVFEELESLKGSSTTNQFMGEFGLILVAAVAVDFLVSILRFTCCKESGRLWSRKQVLDGSRIHTPSERHLDLRDVLFGRFEISIEVVEKE